MNYAARLDRLERKTALPVDTLPMISLDMTPKQAAAIYAEHIRHHSSAMGGRDNEAHGMIAETAAQLYRTELG